MARQRALSPIAALRRHALTKGLLGGSRGWMAVGVAVYGPRLLKKALGRNEEFVTREVLRPGQTVCIRALEPPTRAQRRAARRAT